MLEPVLIISSVFLEYEATSMCLPGVDVPATVLTALVTNVIPQKPGNWVCVHNLSVYEGALEKAVMSFNLQGGVPWVVFSPSTSADIVTYVQKQLRDLLVEVFDLKSPTPKCTQSINKQNPPADRNSSFQRQPCSISTKPT